MEEIIKKSGKGGYKIQNTHSKMLASDFMNSLFWQALGKACWWVNKPNDMIECDICKLKTCQKKFIKGELAKEVTDMNWLFYSIRFHEINLTEGWSAAVKYLEEVIK